MARRKGKRPGAAPRRLRGTPLLAHLSRRELELLIYQQDIMLGQRNLAISEIRDRLEPADADRMYAVLAEELPLDALYRRMGRDEGWSP